MLSKLFSDLDLTEFGKTYGQNKEYRFLTEFGKTAINKTITNNSDKVNENYNNSAYIIKNYNYNGSSPAQIRTGVKGSKGLYACPLHSVFKILPGFPGILL